MINKALSKEDSSVIIFDGEGNLEYSSIEVESFKKLIQDKNKIKKELIDDRILILKDYIVRIEGLDLGFKKHFIASFYNISSRKDNNLLSLAYTDNHTGLYNRNLWYKLEDNIMSLMHSDNYSIIVIDIDHLTNINDLKGINKGDKIIKDIAITIREFIEISDIAIRYGGDEFIVILPDGDENRAISILNSIRNKLNSNFNKEDIKIEISGGIAQITDRENFKSGFIKANEKMNSEKTTKINKEISKIEYYNSIKSHLMKILEISQYHINDINAQGNIKEEIETILSLIYKKCVSKKSG